MLGFADLLAWWNAIYAGPLAVALVWLALRGVARVFRAGGGKRADARHPAGDEPPDRALTWHDFAAIFGYGRLPSLLLLHLFLGVWGAAGLTLNLLLAAGPGDASAVALTLPLTFIIATLVTRTAAEAAPRGTR